MALIYGKPIADMISADTKRKMVLSGIVPGLAVILVGDDASSHLYVNLKEKAAQNIGVHFEKYIFSKDADQKVIEECIDTLNIREDIHGIIVQLPLPEGFDTDAIITRIDPSKDTDGFHKETVKNFLLGDKESCPVFPLAILSLLRSAGGYRMFDNAVVIVNSVLMGEVMTQALLLEGLRAEYILSNESKESIREKTKEAQVIVSASGKANFITGDMIQANSIIIDGGISHIENKIVGDVERFTVENKARFLSPVPGGVGPVTVATLLDRVTDMALRSLTKND